MASYIKTLKEDNGDITYPQTLGSAVLLTGGADLETELAGKASAASVAGKIDIGDVQSSDITTGAVTTAKIDDEAVTSAKVDWTTLVASNFDTVTTETLDGDFYRVDFGKFHILWKYASWNNVTSWTSVGTVPSDLKDGTLLMARWNPAFGYSADGESRASSLNATTGEVKAQIVSPNGNNGGTFLVIIYK